MALTLYVGDIHSDFLALERLVFAALSRLDVERVVVVGDFGFFPDTHQDYWYQKSKLPIPVLFLDGNHDDHAALDHGSIAVPARKSLCFDALHIPRGYCADGVLYMGGATSFDREFTTQGIDWFPEENISDDDMTRARAQIASHVGSIHTMVCHETTDGAFQVLRGGESDRNRARLEELFQLVRPRLFIHGHHHRFRKYEYQGCTFVALRNLDHFHFEIIEARDHDDLLRKTESCYLLSRQISFPDHSSTWGRSDLMCLAPSIQYRTDSS
ncbi:MAG: metallophosphoesterase [Leptospirales bacterium]|nr:metallophosphoesterase [Leptospirales bacterium]